VNWAQKQGKKVCYAILAIIILKIAVHEEKLKTRNFCFIFQNTHHVSKGKAIPVTGRGGP
jgi:hypothetical protein